MIEFKNFNAAQLTSDKDERLIATAPLVVKAPRACLFLLNLPFPPRCRLLVRTNITTSQHDAHRFVEWGSTMA
jgi:hypothetical protein